MRIVAAAGFVAVVACIPRAGVEQADPLCDALREVRSAGLAATLSGFPRAMGGETDRRDADARLSAAGAALGRFVAASPQDIRTDSERVTGALESFIAGINDPMADPSAAVTAAGRTPAQQRQTVASARRVNAVTQERCGEPLVDPGVLGSP